MTEEGAARNDLPDEIVEKILVRLSVYDFVRAGCVCKRLRAFVSSSSRRLVSPSPVSLLLWIHPFEVACPRDSSSHHRDSSAWAYDLSREAWLTLSLAFLQPNLKDSSYPVASAGGLLCFGRDGEYAVCNPMTRSFRRVPTLPYYVRMENGEGVEPAFYESGLQAVGLVYESITGTYELYIIHYRIGMCASGMRMVRYSSALSEWRAMPRLARGSLGKLHSNTITACSSGLYTLWEKQGSLVVYGLCNGVWTEIESPECTSDLLKALLIDGHGTSDLLKASLMDVHGSLHMVGAVGAVWIRDELWDRPTSVHIWKLHVERKEWTEVAQMPSSVLRDFQRRIDFDGLQCLGKDGMVFAKSARSDVLMCDLARNEWRWLKDVEMEADLGSFIFEGSLSASA